MYYTRKYMEGAQRPPEDEKSHFTKAKLMLKNYADGLALFEGGKTPDIVREGGVELWPGCLLVAQVINPDPSFLPDVAQRIEEGWIPLEGDVEPLYALTVYDAQGNERESLAIDAWSGKVTATAEESELFDIDEDAPDYMIESFFRRYWLNHGPMSLADSRQDTATS